MIRFVPSLLLIAPLLCIGCDKPQTAAPPQSAVKTITTPTGIEMALIPAGSFKMGSDKGEDDEKPAHDVTLAGFYMDRYEVTQKAYESLMGTNPAKFKDPQKPVERTSWLSAIKFCNMRSMKEKLEPCYNLQTAECNFSASGYRLPTEAEWEFACRAGTAGDYSFGDNPTELAANAWLKTNSNQTTHPVGQKPANPWGLFDMYGNAAEWCNDRYSDKEYANKTSDNPRGPTTGNTRVLRGGSWRGGPDSCRSSARASETPGLADACFGSEAYGFRCVRSAVDSSAAKP
jgi:formylglycine-generating enzyme required for sulfatase activity